MTTISGQTPRNRNGKQNNQSTSDQKDNTSFLSQAIQFGSNFVKSPDQATIDLALSLIDKAGAPTNATNYLRDLNVSLPYRASSAIRAGWNTLIGNGNFSDNYDQALANPSWYEKLRTIRPLPVTNSNFNKDELEVLRKQSGNGSHGITDADIIRTSGKYGNAGGLSSMFTPNKVAQLSIGKSGGGNGKVTDIFDVNTVSNQAKKDNAMYIKKAKANPGPNYETLRALMPILNMLDIMPNEYKIRTDLNFNQNK